MIRRIPAGNPSIHWGAGRVAGSDLRRCRRLPFSRGTSRALSFQSSARIRLEASDRSTGPELERSSARGLRAVSQPVIGAGAECERVLVESRRGATVLGLRVHGKIRASLGRPLKGHLISRTCGIAKAIPWYRTNPETSGIAKAIPWYRTKLRNLRHR